MQISGDHVTTLMIHIAWLAAILLLGKFIRAKVVLFQKLFLPASIIGGFIGLLLGPYGFGELGFQVIPQDMLATWSTFPGRLINVVFACLFLGVTIPSLKRIWDEGGPQLCYGWMVGMGQYVVGVGITVLFLTPVFGVPNFFGTILHNGFSGGHGTAAGMRQTYIDLGFPAGADLGLMYATVGVISAVVFGMLMINIAARKGYTEVIKSPEEMSKEKISGLIPDESKRKPGSIMTIASDALEPFAFHLSIVGLSILIGWYMLDLIQGWSAGMEPDLFASFPLFPLVMLGGIFIQIVAVPIGLSKYFDRKSFERILGTALDFLVISAIATIKLDVFLSFFWPFMILLVFGLAWVIFATWFLAPRMLPDAWFERGITEYGMQTGVTALGLLLLRASDPNFETSAAESFGFKQIIYEPLMGGGFVTSAAPILLVTYGTTNVYLIAVVSIIIALVVAYFSGWIHKVHRQASNS